MYKFLVFKFVRPDWFVAPFWVAVLSLGLLTGCDRPVEVKQTLLAFGTEVHVQVLTPDEQRAQQAIQAIEAHFVGFNQDWHAWQPDSMLSQINRAIALQQPITVSEEIKQFIAFSQQLSRQSDGLFDPAIGQLVGLWGFHSEQWAGEPPEQQVIKNYLSQPASIQQLNFSGLELHSDNPNIQLDFGGNVKGLALKQAAQILQQHGIENGIINIGGDMLVLGSKQGQAWRIGVQNPKNPQTMLASIEARDGLAVVTSGTYQRFFEWQGKTYSHLLNPNTGYPANTFASVTVIDDDATRADAAATALLIAGQNDWQRIAKQMQVDKVFAIDHQGKLYRTDAIKPLLTVLDE